MNDPKVLTRLLQKNKLLPEEDDYLREGKKVLPVDALSSANKKFLMPGNSLSVQTLSYKRERAKEKAASPGRLKARPRSSGFPRKRLTMIS
jgi:hypothetical protein